MFFADLGQPVVGFININKIESTSKSHRASAGIKYIAKGWNSYFRACQELVFFKIHLEQTYQVTLNINKLQENFNWRDRCVFIDVYKPDDKLVTSGSTSLAGIGLRRTYRAIDSVATGRIPSLSCDTSTHTIKLGGPNIRQSLTHSEKITQVVITFHLQ